MTVQWPVHSVATPTVCFCCSRSWIRRLGSVSWLHTTLMCACVWLTSGVLQRRKGGNVFDHCHGNKWRCAYCMLERFWCVCVCGFYLQVNQCIRMLLLLRMCIQLWGCELVGSVFCVHLRIFHVYVCAHGDPAVVQMWGFACWWHPP